MIIAQDQDVSRGCVVLKRSHEPTIITFIPHRHVVFDFSNSVSTPSLGDRRSPRFSSRRHACTDNCCSSAALVLVLHLLRRRFSSAAPQGCSTTLDKNNCSQFVTPSPARQQIPPHSTSHLPPAVWLAMPASASTSSSLADTSLNVYSAPFSRKPSLAVPNSETPVPSAAGAPGGHVSALPQYGEQFVESPVAPGPVAGLGLPALSSSEDLEDYVFCDPVSYSPMLARRGAEWDF